MSMNSMKTLSALSRACSSSRAACFSLSSTLVKDIPVLASDDTALDRVLALQGNSDTDKAINNVQKAMYEWKESQRKVDIWGKDERNSEAVVGGLAYLLAAVESLTFLPSKEAKCCSRASRRLLGACCDREHTVSSSQTQITELLWKWWAWEQWWAMKINSRKCTYQKIHHYSQFTFLVSRLSLAPQNYQLWINSYPPLIDDCIPALKLLWMRVTSVWDDVLHHGTFNNLAVVELAVSKHSRAATRERMSYTGLTPQQQNQSGENFTTASLFSFNCFSPRWREQSRRMQKDNTEASHEHRSRVKW